MKVDIREIGCENGRWMKCIQWWVLVLMVVEL